MFAFLNETFQRLLDEVTLDKQRYLYDSLDVNQRLIGIVGARGVGKTTLMLQYIKQKKVQRHDMFYFSADNFYFQKNTLIEFVAELYDVEGVRLIFIDEIHKYQNWNQELKNLYDAFPKLHIVFSGSSSIDLVKGTYDLSRRANLLNLTGLSFREYLNFSHNISLPIIKIAELLEKPQQFNASINAVPQIRKYFKEYLEKGFYPFVFENDMLHYQKVLQVIEKAIYEDIAEFYNLKTPNLHLFKKLLNFLASIPPGELNTHTLAKNIGIDNKTANHYLKILSEIGLVNILTTAEGGNQLLRKSEKAYLNNTTLLYALNQTLGITLNVGMLREIFFIQAFKENGSTLFSSKIGDFYIDGTVIEVGGKNKKIDQIKELSNAYLVKDGISIATSREIPLHFFGFLY